MFLYMQSFILTIFFFIYSCTVFLPFFPYHVLPGCFFFYIYHISSPFFLFSLPLILIHVHICFFLYLQTSISACSTQYAFVNIFIVSILFILLRSHLPFSFLCSPFLCSFYSLYHCLEYLPWIKYKNICTV